MREDAVVGVTSNPTIFQKAIASGDAYDEQMREVLDAHRRREGDLLGARDPGHRGRVRRPPARLGRGLGQGRVRLARGRPDARLRPRGDVRPGDAPARGRRPAQPLREDPGDGARPRRDRGLDRPRQADQRHADLLAAALPRGRRGLRPRRRAARGGRRRSVDRRLRGELLRLPRRHRGRPAPRGDRHRRGAGAAREARDREREARVRALPRDRRQRALAAARGRRRDAAAVPLGVDVDEEPGRTGTCSTSRS